LTSQYILPANDDLEFLASIHPAIDALRLCGGFGVSAFDDEAFPGLPTFYVAHRTHFEIFGTLYPLPWRGAHQDSWIADVYRPWKASEINRAVKCRNHVGVGSRFDYGGLDGYTEAVMRGRRRANEWCKQHDDTAHVLTDLDLESAPTIIQEAAA
jgi:hypothetical protein